MMKTFRECMSIDSDEINYLNENIPIDTNQDSVLFKVVFEKIKKTASHAKKFSLKNFLYTTLIPKKYRYYFFLNTINQYNALIGVKKKLDNSLIISNKIHGSVRLEYFIAYLISWVFTPVIIFNYHLKYKKKKEQKYLFSKYFSDRFDFYGKFILYKIFVVRNKPKAVIVANDHSPDYRIMKYVCKLLDIPIIYIQHASVTNKFPKLDFDISLLEGKDSYYKYKLKGIEGCVELIGMPKFDEYYNSINNHNVINSIGISFNSLDSIKSIEGLIKSIKDNSLVENLIIRPHPRDRRYDMFKGIAVMHEIKISNPNIENTFEYLKKIDLNISGESSIHLESVLMNVYPIYYNFGNEVLDYYGYIKNNLVKDVFCGHEEIITFIQSIIDKRPFVRNRSKYYVSTVNTNFDGKSSFLAKKIISRNIS